ncbi:peptidase M24, structural domain-containing protein, partial [Dimargaris cristalligena]
DIQGLRQAGQLAAQTLRFIETHVQSGITTGRLDELVHEFAIERGAYPSPLLYKGFPRSCCTSVNNVMAHGIPDDRPLRDGDIINIDITVYLNGFHGDTSRTFLVGQVDSPGRHLVQVTEEALEKAIAICAPGIPLSHIGATIGEYAKSKRLQVAELLAGHGIGRQFHAEPTILHHINDEPGIMVPGMVFTIEPALCQGATGAVLWPDNWTIATEDGGRSAQFEHMIMITENGCDILTR